MPSRTRLLFVDPSVAPDIGAAHQGMAAMRALHAWAERTIGTKIPRPPGSTAERARYYWNKVPAVFRKKASLYIIRERRDTAWRFSDANPWRRGLRPVAPDKPKAASIWGAMAAKSNPWLGNTEAKLQAAAGLGGNTVAEPDPFYVPPRRKKSHPPQLQQQPKERLKIGIWS